MKLWQPRNDTLVGQLAERLADAMREEYIIDPQGRTVRAKHAGRTNREGMQGTFWADIRDDDRPHMEVAFQQRRQQIVGDCRQLKTDADSYNENSNPGPPIQVVLDFTDDVAELEAMEALRR